MVFPFPAFRLKATLTACKLEFHIFRQEWVWPFMKLFNFRFCFYYYLHASFVHHFGQKCLQNEYICSVLSSIMTDHYKHHESIIHILNCYLRAPICTFTFTFVIFPLHWLIEFKSHLNVGVHNCWSGIANSVDHKNYPLALSLCNSL